MNRRETLSRQDKKTLSLAAFGGALEFYDLFIFIYLAEEIGTLFFPASTPSWLRDLKTWGLFAAGYFARPLGGIVMAHFGDMFGRKRVFILSMILMAVPTLLVGLLPTYGHIGYIAPLLLLLLRILQGASVGGEVPGAWIFVAEHVPPSRVSFACSTLTSGLTRGILVASLLSTALHGWLSSEQMLSFGWRIPFLLGGLFGFTAVLLRHAVAETPVFESIRQRKELSQGSPLKNALRGHSSAVFSSIILTWVFVTAIIVIVLMTPKLIHRHFGIPAETAFIANTIMTFGLALGNLAYSLAADRYGIARILSLGCALLCAATYLFYLSLSHAPTFLYPLSFITGLSVGVVSVIPTVLVSAFPAPVRFTGVAFSYNLSYALFGGLTPLFIGYLLPHYPLAPAHYVAVLCVAGILVVLFTAHRKILEPSLTP